MKIYALFPLFLALPAAAQNGFPVVTHYPMAGGVTPDTTRTAMPAYENYSAARSDEYAPPRQEFDAAVQLMFQATNVQARMLNDPAGLMEGVPQIQVVNNWQIGAALYTVAVPPNWRRTNSYPIFLSGNPTTYSNNFRMFRAGEAGILAFTANKGFIAAYSNAGGIESQGVSDNVLRSVGEAITTFAGLGGDKQKVVTGGFSRGASTAFYWAANPMNLDYNVIAAFGHSLPTSLLAAVSEPYATYAMFGWLSDIVTGDVRLSRYDNVPPPHSFPNRVLQVLTGQGTEDVKSVKSVLERLRGKQLVFSIDTQDAVVPYKTGVAFARALGEANIPVMAVFVQNEGHGWSLDVFNELARAINEIGAGRAYAAPNGRIYAVQNDTANHDYNRQTRVARQTMPLSAVLPYRAASGQPMRIDLCGPPGAQYVVCGVLDGTAALSEVHVSGTIPAEECVSHALAAPLARGTYEWSIIYNGVPMARTLTPFNGHKPRLEVLAMQPGHFEGLVSPLFLAEGLSELSPQFGTETLLCPPAAHGPVPDAGFADSGFQVGSPDAAPVVGHNDAAAPAGATDAGEVDSGNRKPADTGCGCRSTGPESAPMASLFVALALALAWRRRR